MNWFNKKFGRTSIIDRVIQDIVNAELNLYNSQKREIQYYHSTQYYSELLEWLRKKKHEIEQINGGGVTNTDATKGP